MLLSGIVSFEIIFLKVILYIFIFEFALHNYTSYIMRAYMII